MTNFYQRPLLTEDELTEIRQLISTAQWANSDQVLREYLTDYQDNSEMVLSENKTRIAEIAMGAINRDHGFRDMVFPKRSTQIIVSKTDVGQGFKSHYDVPANGDYSTTIFISEPESYGGGELTMFLEGIERKFALPSGHALTYDTGVPHCVKEVSRGERYAIVFWTTSLVKDARLREILGDLRRAKKLLPKDYTYDLVETTNDPRFIIQGVENKIIRYFIDT